MAKDKRFGYDNESHHLIQYKILPPSLIALRNELQKPENKDIYDYANEATTFEGSLANIAEKLDILLDGIYDVPDLCDVLLSAMRRRGLYGTQPHLRDSRLMNVELTEKEGTVEVTARKENEVTLAPGQVENKREATTHICGWPLCHRRVPVAHFLCQTHLWAIPAKMRGTLWATYREGQHNDSASFRAIRDEFKAWALKSDQYAKEAKGREDLNIPPIPIAEQDSVPEQK